MTPAHVDCCNCRWDSGVTGIGNNCFGLGLIQHQLVARRPTLEVDGARFDSPSSNICVAKAGFEGSQHKVECHRHTCGISSGV